MQTLAPRHFVVYLLYLKPHYVGPLQGVLCGSRENRAPPLTYKQAMPCRPLRGPPEG